LETAHTNNPEILPVSNVPHVDPTPMNVSSSINIDVAQPSISSPQSNLESISQNDIAMCDGTSEATPPNSPRNNEDLLAWLVPMIGYLHSISEDTAWQDLVMEFVKFEKSKPPAGVSFCFH